MSTLDSTADLNELKHMVMSFRVSELQVLLGSTGRNKSGRKHDLMSRALQLLKNGCSSKVQQSIKELYHRRFPLNKAAQHMSKLGSPKEKQGHYYNSDMDNKVNGGDYYSHSHSGIRFKILPFYDVLSKIIEPSTLFTKMQRQYSSQEFSFKLTKEQIRMIRDSQEKHRSNSRYSAQVQLRFCIKDTSCDQKDFMPPSLCVQVNRHVAQLPPYIPPSKAGVEPKRACRPIDITGQCKMSEYSNNEIEVTWLSDSSKVYAACINVVQPLPSDQLLYRLNQKGMSKSEYTTDLIKDKLAPNGDVEISTTSLNVSLLCPLGKMRMTLPTRPFTCTHIQCFDAMLFLQMNEKKPTWVCPVCDKDAEFSDLVIDGLFVEILKATSVIDIVFSEDGQWQPVKPKSDSYSLCTPSKGTVDKIVVISPDVQLKSDTNFTEDRRNTEDSGIEDHLYSFVAKKNGSKRTMDRFLKEGRNSKQKALDLSNSPNSSPTNGAKRKEPEIIDLTADSSDDEREPTPPKRKDVEPEEIHRVSSASSHRSDTSSRHTDEKRTPPKRHINDPWEREDKMPRNHLMPSNIFNSTSPRPSSYGHNMDLERSSRPNTSHTPSYSMPSSRDNSPAPLNHAFNPLFNHGVSLPSSYDFSQTPLDFPYYLSSFADPLRRLPGEHSRLSPFLLNPSTSHHYLPSSTRSSNSEHMSRNFLSHYTPHYPYSPVPFLPTQDNSDIIPID